MDRREFVHWCAAGVAASPFALPLYCEKLPAIGLQLYTVRSLLRDDFEGTLARVAEVGYAEVELAGTFGRTAQQLRAILDRLRLRAPSTHVSKEALEKEPQKLLDDAAALGHRYVCVAWMPEEERRTLDDWKRIAQAFNAIGERCRRAGFQFAYHNHDFEFVRQSGSLPYDTLLAETDPALVQLELDLYWITRGGANPFDYFKQFPGRFPMVHVKDSAGPPEHRMVDVGRGTIDFQRIFAQRQAGIRHFFVEHDEPADPLASIRASYEHLKQLEF
jgi:sugar phosphate isomerase/epimerase